MEKVGLIKSVRNSTEIERETYICRFENCYLTILSKTFHFASGFKGVVGGNRNPMTSKACKYPN